MIARTNLHAAALPFGFAALMLAAPAASQSDAQTERGGYLEALQACQGEVSDAARLACYDMAVGKMITATEEGELRVVDRSEMREARRKLFGFSLPDFGLFKGKGQIEEEELAMVETTIAGVRPSANRGWLLTTAEGAVWQIDDVPNRLMTPRVSQSLELRKGSMGSYFIRINGQPGIKGTRVR